MLRPELKRLMTWGERHRLLIARLALVAILTLVVDAIGTVLVYYAERGAPDSEITSLGDALFFTTTQLLTVSSQIRNPFTTWGRVVDVCWRSGASSSLQAQQALPPPFSSKQTTRRYTPHRNRTCTGGALPPCAFMSGKGGGIRWHREP